MEQPFQTQIEHRVTLPWMDAALAVHIYASALERHHFDERHVINHVLEPWVGRTPVQSGIDMRSGSLSDVGGSFMTPARLPLRFRLPGRRKVRALRCSFDAERFDGLADLPLETFHAHLGDCLSIEHAGVTDCLLRIARELHRPGFASGLVVESLGVQLAVEIARYIRPRSGHEAARHFPSRHMRLIEDRCRSDEEQMPTVGELAALCGISPRHLLRMFKQEQGMTLSAYIADMRVERARRLLANSRMPLKAIAYRLGFAGPPSFCTAFRRASGMTPLDYRRRYS